MPRRRKRPSQLRFLVPVLTGAPTLAVLWTANSIQGVVCKPGIPCPGLPPVVTYTLLAVFCLGFLASGYRAYRDFVLGEYWIDLVDER